MTWTYDLSDLSTNEKDQIRLEIGDTDEQAQLLQDEEIVQAISVERNFWSASARCCEMISRLFLRRSDVKLGRALSVTYTKMAEQYLNMAILLRKKALGSGVVPYVGGMSVSQKILQANNPDIVAPLFTKTMMESPYAAPYLTDSTPPVGGGPTEPLVEEEG